MLTSTLGETTAFDAVGEAVVATEAIGCLAQLVAAFHFLLAGLGKNKITTEDELADDDFENAEEEAAFLDPAKARARRMSRDVRLCRPGRPRTSRSPDDVRASNRTSSREREKNEGVRFRATRPARALLPPPSPRTSPR